jgi:hypothetical protein
VAVRRHRHGLDLGAQIHLKRHWKGTELTEVFGKSWAGLKIVYISVYYHHFLNSSKSGGVQVYTIFRQTHMVDLSIKSRDSTNKHGDFTSNNSGI